MIFGNLRAAYLFFLIIPLFIFYFLGYRRSKKAIENFAQKEFLPHLISSQDTKKLRIKVMLVFGAFIFCILALMRPQWGLQSEEVKRSGLDIIVALDTSRSMVAEDVKPNRLELSKLAVRDFVKRLKGDRIGLIAFSGAAFLVCPLTVDYNAFMLSLDSLDVHTIPRGSTSISSAIMEAIKGFKGGQKKTKVLVLITDGEDHEGDPVKAAWIAQKEGIKIFCIGVGTTEGELIQINDENGQKAFLKDRQGNVVKSRLIESTLQKIALNTGGDYMRAAQSESNLGRIYEERLSKMEKGEIEGKMRKRYKEWFQIPLAIALLLLIFEPLIGQRKKK